MDTDKRQPRQRSFGDQRSLCNQDESSVLSKPAPGHRPKEPFTVGVTLQGFLKGDERRHLQTTPQRHSGSDPIPSCLQLLGNNHNIDITDLITKSCFLLVTCGPLYPDDLVCTDVSQCTITRDELNLAVVFPKEKQGGQMIIKTVVIKPHPVEFFCPVKSYVEYRRRTLDYDRFARTTHPKGETTTFTPPMRQLRRANLGLSTQQISKYVNEIMPSMPRDETQPPYKARAVGTTAALKKGIQVDGVITHSNCSPSAIVEAFYRIPRSLASNFTTAISPDFGSTDRVPGEE